MPLVGPVVALLPNPTQSSGTMNAINMYDGTATGLMRLENKTVKSGIDNSIFEVEGAKDIGVLVPPLCTAAELTTISSINIDSSVADPKVTTIASYNVSSAATATLTLSAAQTLEDNELLTLNGAGQTITITGDITVKNAEASATLRLDIDQFITATTETA